MIKQKFGVGLELPNGANVFDLETKLNSISAKHDGYKRLNIIHQRTFSWNKNEIIINDLLSKSSHKKAKAFFHLHSSILKPQIKSNKVFFKNKNVVLTFIGHTKIILSTYRLSQGFNKTKSAFKLVVYFEKELKTHF